MDSAETLDVVNASPNVDDSLSAAPYSHAQSTSRSQFRRIVLTHLFFAVFGALAWCSDALIFRTFNSWFNGPQPPKGELFQLIISAAMFGQGLGMVLSVLLIWLLDRKRERAVMLMLVLVAAGVGSWSGKLLIGRERPLESQGASVLHGPTSGLTSSRHQSMPSGHTTTAAALAVAIGFYYPSLRTLAIALAVGVGLNRVITVAHYPSDVVFGGWLGAAIGYAVVRSRWANASAPRCLAGLIAVQESAAKWFAGAALLGRRGFRMLIASPLLPATAALILFWSGNADTPLWDRDEPRFAAAAREMLERNDWIVPTFNGDLRPDKPIFVYWLMMAAYSIFGVGEFAARFFSGLAGALAVFAIFLLGRSMFDRRVGLVAAWISALTPMVVIESKICTADGVLFGFLTLATFCLWRIAAGARDAWTAAGFWIAVGFACLTKGPVAVGILGGTALVFSILIREWRWLGGLRWTWGPLVLAVIVGPWCYLVQDSTNGEFLAQALGKHVIERSRTALENHHGFPGYYVASLFLLMSPWSWALPWAFHHHGRRLFADRRVIFLLAWMVGPLLMFEAVRTKLVHYYLPAYPAAALLIASAWAGRFGGAPLGYSTIGPFLGRLTAAVGGVVMAASAIVCLVVLPSTLAAPAVMAGVAVAGSAMIAGLLLARRMPQPAFRAAAVGTWCALFVGAVDIVPKIGQGRVIVDVARRLEKHKSDRIAFWHYRDPSLIFNLGGGVYPVFDQYRFVAPLPDARILAASGPFLCPLTAELLAELERDPELRTEIAETIARRDGAMPRGKTIHLVRVSSAPSAVASKPKSSPK